jgi:hypothetical protein
MAGSLKYDATNTSAIKSADVRLTKAFAEGRRAQIAGTNSNPHPSGSDAYEAWQEGHDTTSSEGLIDSCAECIPISVPDVVGMTSANAQAAIIAANLLVGKITLTTGNVTIQDPVASAKVQRNTPVLITLTE